MLRSTFICLTASLSLLTACGDTDPGDRGQEAGEADDGLTGGNDSTTGTDTDTGGTNTGGGDTGTDDGVDGPDDTGQDDDSTDTDTGTDCGAVDIDIEPVTPMVMLMLDKSGSMMEEWDYNGNQVTRWYTLHDVVSTTVTELNEKAEFGLEFFPGSSSCDVNPDVDVAMAENNAAAIIAAMPAANAIVSGGTPATAAFEDAITHLNSWTTDQPKVIILVTDGAANCIGTPNNLVYDPQFNVEVEEGFVTHGIPTYVVGIDIQDEVDDGRTGSGVNLWDQLNDVAVKGGVPKNDPATPNEQFYNAADGASLQAAIDEISNQIESCVLDFGDEVPAHPNWIEVTVNGGVVTKVDDCETENGYVWVNPDGPFTSVELCGTACENFKEIGVADIVFGCPPVD